MHIKMLVHYLYVYLYMYNSLMITVLTAGTCSVPAQREKLILSNFFNKKEQYQERFFGTKIVCVSVHFIFCNFFENLWL